MAAKPIPIVSREKIAKFLLSALASEHAPEAHSALAMITAELKRAGCDKHDLAAALRGQLVEAMASFAQDVPPQYRDQMRPFGARPYASRTQGEFRSKAGRAERTSSKGDVWSRELLAVITIMGPIDDNERAFTFLEGLRLKASRNAVVKLSSKQDAWLRALAKAKGVVVPWSEIEADAA